MGMAVDSRIADGPVFLSRRWRARCRPARRAKTPALTARLVPTCFQETGRFDSEGTGSCGWISAPQAWQRALSIALAAPHMGQSLFTAVILALLTGAAYRLGHRFGLAQSRASVMV
jgi:hypothetical protein